MSSSGSVPSTKTFQLNTKCLFLTYPQCHTPLDVFARMLLNRFGDLLAQGVCSRELHMDGNPHLHAALMLKSSFRSRDPKVFDSLVVPPRHPNISGKFDKGPKRAFLYVMKDKNYLPLPSDFALEEFVQAPKSERVSLELVKAISEGSTLDELDERFPAYLLLHLTQVQRYLDFRTSRSLRYGYAEAQKIPVRVMPADDFCSSWNSEIGSWLNLNLRRPRVHRQKQLWISAGPATGKTSLILWLETTFKINVYYWPRDEKWWDGYSDNAYDLIVLDEYRAQKMITELNPILSGDPTPLSRRNAPPLVKRHNLPVLILSNFHPTCCYSKVMASQLAPLLDRLQLVEVPTGGLIRLAVLPDEPPPTVPSSPIGLIESASQHPLWDDTPYMSIFPIDHYN